jgi:biotin transport system substrate-specific component
MAVITPAPRVLADVVARSWVANLVLVLGGSAFVGISAQVVIPLPFTPVPLTLQTFAVLLVGAALGTWRGVASMVVYAAAGTAGMPWFSAGSSGWGGASYGYILGFIIAAGVVGRLAERGATLTPLRTAGLMVVGNVVIYTIGVTYLKFAIDASWATALALGVVPFLVGDALKIALAAGLLPGTWRLLSRAGIKR